MKKFEVVKCGVERSIYGRAILGVDGRMLWLASKRVFCGPISSVGASTMGIISVELRKKIVWSYRRSDRGRSCEVAIE
jgi:hypothetical protein